MSYQPPQQPPLAWQPPPRKPKRTGRTIGLIVGVGSLVIIAIAIGASAGSKSKDHGSTTTAPGGSPGISRGLAAHDASADVRITSCGDQSIPGIAEGLVSITNHSGKRSDYAITVVYLAKDGAHVGEGIASATAVEAHQKARTQLIATTTGAWASCKVTEVQRTASL